MCRLQPGSVPTPDSSAVVLSEVEERRDTIRDRAQQRKVCASVVDCEHDVTFAQTSVPATRCDRGDKLARDAISGPGSCPSPAGYRPDVSIPFAEARRWTPLGPPIIGAGSTFALARTAPWAITRASPVPAGG